MHMPTWQNNPQRTQNKRMRFLSMGTELVQYPKVYRYLLILLQYPQVSEALTREPENTRV